MASFESVGLIRVRGCCLFTWRERVYGKGPRVVEVSADHCQACVEELWALKPSVLIVAREKTPLFPPTSRPRRVLVVDDDSRIRDAFEAALGDVGCEVATAEHGRAALEHLRSGEPPPDVIILDLIMPEMDGYQFRAEQKQDPALASIPVVVVTAAGLARPLDAAKVLRKPIDLEVLLEVLHLTGEHTPAPQGGGRAPPGSGPR
jgi:CheY-like chemotaxis protein